MKYKTLLMLGAPGCGKGTWGKILGEIPGFFHLSSGDMFRGLNKSSEIGKLCMSFINKGELVPNDVTIQLWKEHMTHLKEWGAIDPIHDYLCLDGIPRNRIQAGMMDDFLDVKVILSFRCNDQDILVQRMKRRALIEHRSDDANEETIRHRFEIYESQTKETLDYYPDECKRVITVALPETEILHQISTALRSTLSPS